MALQATPRQHNGDGQTAGDRLRPVPAPAGESDSTAAQEAGADTSAEQHQDRDTASEHSGRAEADEGAEAHRGNEGASASGSASAQPGASGQSAAPARRKPRAANRRPSGRERHDEKITVYVSAEELMDLEHARLVLRGEHGLAVDRGRIVREAVAVVLADLESRGDASILVRRLRGR
ncbi:hypothetical protein [Wenjunlia tyrosinilytica]|nr:hypothetical protein [Wenjunlia tyrosinilytica]